MNIWNEIAVKFKRLGASATTEEIAAALKTSAQSKLRAIVDKYAAFGSGNGSGFTSVEVVVLLASREGNTFKAILGTKSPLVRLAVIHYDPDHEV